MKITEMLDPLPLHDGPVVKSEKVFSHAERESFRPLLKSVAALNRALEAGTVSDRDRVLIKMAFENIETCRVNVDPLGFGETEEHNAKILRIMGEKYAGTPADAGETLAKRARSVDRSKVHVGMRVKGFEGRVGKIVRVRDHAVDIEYDDGAFGTAVIDYLEAA